MSLKEIQYQPSESEETEMKPAFSSNVSTVMEHRIPNGTERNMSCFQSLDGEKNKVPVEVIPGNQRIFARKVDNTLFINQKCLGTDKMIAFSTGNTASVAKRKEKNHSIA